MNHGAGAAGFSPRNRAALALIFFMHISALLVWTQQRRVRPPEVPQAVTILLRPPAPQREPEPPRAAAPIPRPMLPPAFDAFGGPQPSPAKPAASPPAETPAQAAPASPPALAPGLDDARAPTTVRDPIREQKEADGGFGLNLSKRQAGRIDRELRGGKSGVPDEPDTPMGRFRRGLERAHVDRSLSVYEDSYTSPDGTVFYRKRIGKATICRRSGNVSPLGMGGVLFGNEAGNVPCPKGVDWKKD